MMMMIDYENIRESWGFKYCWIDIVTHYLFEVVESPISIDVHKGGIQDYI